MSFLGFFVVLGPLVIVHELGHFLFARLFNVKAEIFSIGFGPRLWSWQRGETEWRVSAIPLGGYVKLMGEEGESQPAAPGAPDESHRALQRQAPWKRFLIFFGGPLFNFLFAVVVFMAILVIGEPQAASVAGRVVRGSEAEKAGFVSGDEIVAVDGKPVRRWEDVQLAIHENPGKAMKFEVRSPGAPATRTLTATPMAQHGFSIYGERRDVGEIDGLYSMPRSTMAGVSNPASLAGRAGIKTGDKILAFASTPVKTWEEMEKAYETLPPGAAVTLKVAPKAGGAPREVTFTKSAAGERLSATGLYSSELFIEKVIEGSPAEKAGLKPGDRLVGIGAKDVESFLELKDAVQRSGEESGKVVVRWEREGQMSTQEIVPNSSETRDPALTKTTQFTVGVVPQLTWAEPVTFVERTLNPFLLVYGGAERMVVHSWRNLVSIVKMFKGDVSLGTLGGPILIGKLAGESLGRGLISFLTIMAMLSVGLGVLNILPVPVLDGGHLLLLGIEMVRGKPLTIRQMEVVQQVGLSMILLLMAVVIKNDLTRLTSN